MNRAAVYGWKDRYMLPISLLGAQLPKANADAAARATDSQEQQAFRQYREAAQAHIRTLREAALVLTKIVEAFEPACPGLDEGAPTTGVGGQPV